MDKKGKVGTVIVMVLVMLAGIGMLVWGISGTNKRAKESKEYLETTGITIDVKTHRNKDSNGKSSGTTYSGVYSYIVDGVEYMVEDEVSTSNKPSVGEKKTIKYNPGDPSQAYVKGGASTSLILIGIGVLFIIVPFVMLIPLLGDNVNARLKDYLSSFLMGIIFAGMGFGLMFIAKPGIFVDIFLLLFGVVGIYLFFYPFYHMIFKRNEPYGQKIVTASQKEVSDPGRGSAVGDFVEEHSEQIDKGIDIAVSAAQKIEKGRNLVGNIVGIFMGAVFVIFPGYIMVSTFIPAALKSNDPGVYIFIAFTGVFVLVGIFSIIKCIKNVVGWFKDR